MGRKLGEREMKSARKAASCRENAKKPRPSRQGVSHANMAGHKSPELLERQRVAIEAMRGLWPACDELIRQIVENDLRDKHGKPLRENGRLVRVPLALRATVTMDLYDRTGRPRQTHTTHAPENLFEELPQLVGSPGRFPKPETRPTNGHATNGTATH